MQLGERLSERFVIEQQVGAGGMGEVFRARDPATGEAVAVKVISDTRGHRSARFAREVELLAELSHPGIVRYISHGETPEGELYLVMEWLEGEDLAQRVARAPLTVGEAVGLATRVAQALGAAHARGIVHRDLKPSNLFLPGGRVEQVKVLDFGIALREGSAALTKTGVMIGTPGYMAPEQARDHGVVDARADVFALGCVLFSCLTGRPAFEGDSAIAIVAKILFGETPRVSALWPEVPPDLDALVAQMLAKEPAQRPSDGANLAAALAALGPEVHTAAVAPRGAAARPQAITGSERRWLSVVLLGRPAGGDAAADALGPGLAEELRRAIKPYGGRLEPLADGSAIVVLEAERQVATDRAAQAARCALAIRALAGGRPLAIAMGHADAPAGATAGDALGGGVVDRASRLLPAAAAAGAGLARAPVALDEMTAGLLDARFEVAEHEAGLLLHGERALAQGARTVLGRPTACVGRDWELGALTAVFDECVEEPEARVAVVTAPAGVGKSRLGAELLSRLAQRGAPVAIWIGRGDSLRAGSTLDLLAQALRGALGIRGGEPLEDRRAQIRARVAERLPAGEQKRVAEFLGELVGAPFSDDGPEGAALRAARQDAPLMSEQMRRAWMDLLAAEAAVQPVVLVLEDLHWGDFGTVRFIDTALRERSKLPWMVLALARPEVYETFPRLWAERQNVQKIRLKELGKKASERLVRQVLGDRVGAEAIERLVKQADGNAFYLEELIRAAAEGRDGALPETVVAMVETRLGRLPLQARRVLRAAAVFGEVGWAGGVTELLGGALGPAAVGEELGRLVEQEILAERPASRFPGERELAFRHALLREGAYALLTDDDRRLGHRLAGEWLERHGETDPMGLAGHFERGGEGARAAAHYLRASEQAFHVLDLDATMARAALGLGCAPPPELRLGLLGMRCEAATAGLHLITQTMPDAEELMRTAPRGTIEWAQGANAFFAGALLSGRIPELMASIAELREIEPAPGAARKVVMSLLNGVCILDMLGQVTAGSALEARFREVAAAAGERELVAQFWWRVVIGMRAAYAHEDPWEGFAYSEEIRPIYEQTGGELIHLNMQLFGGMNLWFLGDFEASAQALEGIPGVDEALGVVSYLRRFSLAWMAADRGALAEARALATALRDHGAAAHNALEEGRGRWVLAEVLRRMGELEAADAELPGALAAAVPLEHPGVLGTLAALRLAQGRAAEALAAAEDAAGRCAAMGGCGMFRGAFVRLVHAEALRATGAEAAARAAIADARARLQAAAARIADPAHRRSFLERVPENARTLELARAWLGDGAPAA